MSVDFDLNDRVRRTIAEQHDEIAALRAENAKLKELARLQAFDLERMTDNRNVLYAQNAKLQDENAKLRELLADLAICACGKHCYGCPHQHDGCDRDQRLRELGIEVD